MMSQVSTVSPAAVALGADRVKRGMTQSAYAEFLGLTQPTVCKLEGGKLQPTFELALKIERRVGIVVADWGGVLGRYLRKWRRVA